jgi:drug/metabolite transporter (DMT)-like permease
METFFVSEPSAVAMTSRDFIPVCCRRFQGFSLAIVSALFFSCNALMTTYLRDISGLQCLFFRLSFAMLVAATKLLYDRRLLQGMNIVLQWIAGVFAAGGIGSFYISVKNMEIGAASAIFFSQPLVVTILAFIFLNETISRKEVLIIAVILVGLVFVVQPTAIFGTKSLSLNNRNRSQDDLYEQYGVSVDGMTCPEFYNITQSFEKLEPSPAGNSVNSSHANRQLRLLDIPSMRNWTCEQIRSFYESNMTSEEGLQDGIKISRAAACACAIVGMVAVSAMMVITRASEETDVYVITFHQNLSGAVVSAVLVSCFDMWSFPNRLVPWLLIGGVSIGFTVCMFTLYLALSLEKASTVSIARSSEILFSYILQITLEGLYPNHFNVVGAILVTIGALCLAPIHGTSQPDEEYSSLDEAGSETIK